ncbi:MAG: translocation/assembly module TamB domain-containing protein [Chitinophagales bacterium]
MKKKAITYLEKKLQTRVSIGKIYIGLPKKVVIEDFYIEDKQKDTLLAAGSLKMDINILKLIFKGEIDVNQTELKNSTAKIKRQLPDTVFNFQFIVDAFAPKDTSNNLNDTAATPLDLGLISLDNVRLVYNDVITGSDMESWIDHLDTRIDNFDTKHSDFDFPETNIDGATARIYQVKPLASPEPEIKDQIEAREPTALHLAFNQVNVKNFKLDYRNDVSATYANIDLGELNLKPNKIDLNSRIIELQDVTLENTIAAIRLGRKQEAREVVQEVKQEVESQSEAGWDIKVVSLDFNNSSLQFDNDNSPRQTNGIDYSHLKLAGLTLQIDDLLLNQDSIGGKIRKGEFKEQSGFVLNELQADVLYANNQAYLKDLLLRTPGSEVKRYALLRYDSYKAFARNFERTQIDADIENSHVQVKDILAFAPQLRSQPAFSNPNDTWFINLQGNGTLQSMHIRDLQFDGLKNTQINASGSLAANNDPTRTGARLTIKRLHTSQTDIALFTGRRLSNEQVNLPEEFNAHGTLAGSINNLSANLAIATSVGAVSVNGRFTNLSNPDAATYTALVKTNSLNIGSILRNDQLSTISSDLTISGKGFTPEKMDIKFKGPVYAVGYNDYLYRNINLDGSLRQNSFAVNADINDPNVALNGTATGTLSANPSFRFAGMIDSIKTLPLHLTTQPLVVRGKIDADVPVMNKNYLEANVLITKALFVSSSQRLSLDTLRFIAGRTDTAQFMEIKSDVANARISGQYRYTDLGKIFQKSIEPYFSVTPTGAIADVQPYNFSFTADIGNAPVLAAFIPGLNSFEPVYIKGRAASGEGLTATMNTAYVKYNGNEIHGLNVNINTTDNEIRLAGDVQQIKGIGLNIYHTRLNATASNNRIDFNLGIDDKAAKNKYYFAGIVNKTPNGNYAVNLRPDSLLLNYERWTISPNNSLTITKDNIIASNFTLQNKEQRLTLQGESSQLTASFTNFQLSTITAFTESDSLLVNGSMNGNVTFRNILRQPVFTSDLTINDLSMKGDTLGNAVIKVDNTSGNRFNTKATITGRGNDIELTGSFAPQGDKDIALDLQLAIRQLQLTSIEGAFGNMIKNASGSVNGDITIKGTTEEMKIDGPLNFDKTSFAISALGSQFRMDGQKVTVTRNGFHFDNFVIRDTANNELILNGLIQTPNFTNYFFDFDLTTTNFQILNSTKKDNKIYYGKLFITSRLHIDGSETRPIVDGNITVNEGTNLFVAIPQREPGVVEREGIVEFVDMDAPENDSLFHAYDSLNVSGITGMDITTNIEIRKEAIFNIVLDEANGDFLNLQGEALLSTGIDPSGKITLIGTYEIDKGAYEITFNFLHRRFDIQKGSKIVWLNEPTKATMDVKATYIANTAPIDLVESRIAASSQAIRNTYMQKLPFEVQLFLTGELLQPKIRFDIVLPTDKNYGVSNDIITQVESRLEQLRQETGEVDKQVFSLLLLNRFVGENPLESSSPMFNAGSYARQSVSKLLTSQLNKLAAGLIDGVDLTFDVVSTDDYTTGDRRNRTDLNIGISKRVLSDRLTIAVGSNYELEGPKNSNQKPSNIIGNLSLNYAISRDGRYALRFYRKNAYEGIVDGYIVESGLSFIISVDYNRFTELIRRKKKQRVDGVRYTNN